MQDEIYGVSARSAGESWAADRDDDPTSELEPVAVASTTAVDATQNEMPPRSVEPTAPAALIRGRYLLEEQPIGAGGTAIIWRARDLRGPEDGMAAQYVALKLLRPELSRQPAAINRLKLEFQHAQSLSHPNIARVFDLDCDGDLWFLTMELLDGESLATLLKRQGAGTMPARRAGDILRACGEALVCAHQRGIVHGDFKPANVFITRTGQVRLLDFGAATHMALPGDVHLPAATLAYASPEVLSGARPERRDDIFSLACVAYELLTGQHPFGRRSALVARDAGHEPVRAWHLTDRQWYPLEAALAWQRESRPANVRTFLTELLCVDTPTPLVIPSVESPAVEFRPPAMAPLRAVLAVAVLGVAVTIAFFQLQDHPDAATHFGQGLADVVGSNRSPLATAAADALPVSSGPTATAPGGLKSGEVASEGSPAVPARTAVHPDSTAVTPAPGATRSTATRPAALAVPGSDRGIAAAKPLVSFDAASVVVSENAVAAVLMLSRRDGLSSRTSVHWRAVPGTALAGRDLANIAAGTAEFAAGQASRAIFIPLLNDRLKERDEKFVVELYNPSGNARIGPRARTEVTIRDDDSR